MPRGRKPGAGTPAEKAAARREKVRLNVQAFRKRQKAAGRDSSVTPDGFPIKAAIRWVQSPEFHSDSSRANESSNESDTNVASDSSPESEDLTFKRSPNSTSDDQQIVLRSPNLSIAPDFGKQYTLALLDLFRCKFLPQRIYLPTSSEDTNKLRTPCALWVTTAHSLAVRQESGAMTDVLLSIILAFVGLEQQRVDLQILSGQFYRRTLQKIRRDVNHILNGNSLTSDLDAFALFLSCHAAALFELFVNGSLENTRTHVRGIGLLIEHQSDRLSLSRQMGDTLIEEYRLLEITFCFVHRRPSTMTRRKTSAVDKNQGKSLGGSSTIFTRQLDAADEIIPIMVHVDVLRGFGLPPASMLPLQRHLQHLLSIRNQLDELSTELQDRFGPVYQKMEPADDSADGGIKLLSYTSFEIGFAWTWGLAFKIYAIETEIAVLNCIQEVHRMTEHKPTHARRSLRQNQVLDLRTEVLEASTTLARSLPYFLESDQSVIVRSTLVPPLEAAFIGLESEIKRLAEDESSIVIHDDAGDEFFRLLKQKKEQASWSMQLCNGLAAQAKMFGLPLFSNR